MKCRDGLPDKGTTLGTASLWVRRWVKYGVVRVWPDYFHQHSVAATYDDMVGRAPRARRKE
jgi:hypothetical protein